MADNNKAIINYFKMIKITICVYYMKCKITKFNMVVSYSFKFTINLLKRIALDSFLCSVCSLAVKVLTKYANHQQTPLNR
jgi:hypothetical protein